MTLTGPMKLYGIETIGLGEKYPTADDFWDIEEGDRFLRRELELPRQAGILVYEVWTEGELVGRGKLVRG